MLNYINVIRDLIFVGAFFCFNSFSKSLKGTEKEGERKRREIALHCPQQPGIGAKNSHGRDPLSELPPAASLGSR